MIIAVKRLFPHVKWLCAALVGAGAGLLVFGLSFLSETLHVYIYNIAFDQRLSAQAHVPFWPMLLALCGGGLALGLLGVWHRHRPDPLEAYALHDGRLRWRDGVVVALQALLSNGVGASVGLEAAFAHMGATLGSLLARLLRLEQEDRRLLLASGTAGAIAAAFNAPLAGSFYACELIIGTYSLSHVMSVCTAALAGYVTVSLMGGAPYSVVSVAISVIPLPHYLAFIGLGLSAAVLGILMMKALLLFERAFQIIPLCVRPMWGGVMITALATVSPQVLGAGHGALALDSTRDLSALSLLVLIGLKLVGCWLSLASGFRGGLFFASLFLGALWGKLYALSLISLLPVNTTACLLTGMAALGTSVIGTPMTMTLLVLEASGSIGLAGPVLAACIASHTLTKGVFGFSYTTLRLHLHGVTLSG